MKIYLVKAKYKTPHNGKVHKRDTVVIINDQRGDLLHEVVDDLELGFSKTLEYTAKEYAYYLTPEAEKFLLKNYVKNL